MTLREYKEAQGLSTADLADMLDCSPQSVNNWLTDPPSIPGRRAMRAIHNMTSGKVDANAFFGLGD